MAHVGSGYWLSGASGIGAEFKAARYWPFSTDEHLNAFLSGSDYSISAVRYSCFLDELSDGKLAYESLSADQFVPTLLDIGLFHGRVFRLYRFRPDLMERCCTLFSWFRLILAVSRCFVSYYFLS